METHRSRTWSKTILLILVPTIFVFGPAFLSVNTAAYFDCCKPPAYAAAAARFPPGANITVYIPPNSGLTPDEITAFKQGMEDWNDEANNSQVDFTVISEVAELKSLGSLGLATLEFDYKESKRTDENGNEFRYRAKVRDIQGSQVGRWAWDVFLVAQQ